METIAKYSEAEIYSMNGITLEKEGSFVNVKSGVVEKLTREGAKVTLHVTKPGKTEIMGIPANIRSVKYLNTKTVKGKRPFGETAFKSFMNAEKGEMVPVYKFPVFVLCEKSTGIGFGLTFKPLVPLNEKIFSQFMKGEKWQPVTNIPFELGKTEISTKLGAVKVNFGKYNGNSGVEIITPGKVAVKLTGKHLGNSIALMCRNLKTIVSSEKVQGAGTKEELETILETFRGTTM